MIQRKGRLYEKNYKVLVADDDINIIRTLKLMLKLHNFDVIAATQPDEALSQLREEKPDIALVDLNYQRDTTSGREGLELIAVLKHQEPELPIVVMTGWGSIDIAVEAMKNGAADFIQKPWDNERLLQVLNIQLQLVEGLKKQQALLQQNTLLQQQLHPCLQDELVTQSPAMKQVMLILQQVIPSDASILLTGENGTGKSMLASYIHQHSTRKDASFVSVNMGCIPDSLFESEMFGHVKGAFTDAKTQRIGRFELADGGTLFLDEVGNVPLNQQAKLLRMLEEQQFEKVGASRTQTADVRVISATNADLSTLLNAGDFRRDLYYRLNTFEVRIPSLRERKEDIPELVTRMLRNLAERYRKPMLVVSEEAMRILQAYPWPGNIRELNHTLERTVLLSTSNMLDKYLLSQALPSDAVTAFPGESTLTQSVSDGEWTTLEDIVQHALQKRLAEYNGNANDAAESMGLSRSAFYRRLKRTG
ncbi:sigma-54 dependent transcriptional regulator [Erwinia sp. E_sp_B04_7]|uniref:sigma-54-dependent transcriptional regulator n=1 Tax=unclassified Erwinia TaxID=2622719 RepID=UPI0030CB06B5